MLIQDQVLRDTTEMFDDDDCKFAVAFNHAGQFSIWPADRLVPAGWTLEGTVGTKSVCLEAIERLWVDMRPLSIRAREGMTHA